MYNLDEFYGNNGLRDILKNSVSHRTFPKVSLFTGEGGTGKSSIAKIVAMTLTCHEHKDSPCCKCISCRNNIAAFGGSGLSMNTKVINLGLFLDKKDVNELIDNIFTLRDSDENLVYIFEEVHALADIKGAQTAFLAEIDKMPNNVYIIMCTTRPYMLIPELRSRAINFKFSKLNRQESINYLNTFGKMDGRLISTLIETCNGNPRKLKMSAEFVVHNDVSFQQYIDTMQVISDSEILDIYNSIGNLKSYLTLVNRLIEKYQLEDIYKKLDNFFSNAFWLTEGVDIEEIMIPAVVTQVKEIFDSTSVRILWDELRKYNISWEKEDVIFFFAKSESILHKLKRAGGFNA